MLDISRETFGSLKCLVVTGQSAQPNRTVVLSHGYGANSDDLASIGAHLLQQDAGIGRKARFVFPEAPHDLGSLGMLGGRAWWPINMAALAEMHQAQNFDQLTELTPDGMDEASDQLTECLVEISAKFQTSIEQILIGGFSQGAMISTNVVLQNQWRPARLLIYSGTVLCRQNWTQLAASHPGCAVSQFHGRQDPVLPFGPAESLRDLLITAGFDVHFQDFIGQHTIPDDALFELKRRLLASD